MYMCVSGTDFATFYYFSNGFWNCSDSVVFFVFLYNTFSFLPFSVADLRGFLSVEPSLDVDLLPSLNIKISKLKESCLLTYDI